MTCLLHFLARTAENVDQKDDEPTSSFEHLIRFWFATRSDVWLALRFVWLFALHQIRTVLFHSFFRVFAVLLAEPQQAQGVRRSLSAGFSCDGLGWRSCAEAPVRAAEATRVQPRTQRAMSSNSMMFFFGTKNNVETRIHSREEGAFSDMGVPQLVENSTTRAVSRRPFLDAVDVHHLDGIY